MKPEGVFLPENANTPNHNVDVAGTEHENVYVRRVERKSYELTDHLGNVRVVLSDVKTTTEADGTGKPQGPYKATLLAANNYYPFGMLQPGRHWSTGEYRYGYNGQEKVDEIAGHGNHTTALFWEYDTRLGRRWNVDIRPNISLGSYVTFADNPILYSDVLGDSINIGNLLEKDKDGNLVNRQSVQMWERFLKTKKGQEWIRERAQAGFIYEGQIDKNIRIHIKEEGRLSKKGIDYSFDFNSEYTNGGETTAIIVDNRVKVRVDLGAAAGNEYYPSVFKKLSSLLHEAWYHGFHFEQAFLGSKYKTQYQYDKENDKSHHFILPTTPIDHQHYTSSGDFNKAALSNSLFSKYGYSILKEASDTWNLHDGQSDEEIRESILSQMRTGFFNYYSRKREFNNYIRTR